MTCKPDKFERAAAHARTMSLQIQREALSAPKPTEGGPLSLVLAVCCFLTGLFLLIR